MQYDHPVTAVIVGAGHRAQCYAGLSQTHPEMLQIVGVADLNPARVAYTAKRFRLAPEQCFDSAEALYRRGRIADAVINGTRDGEHVDTTIPFLAQGYDILLEKPFATSEADAERLAAAVRRSGCKVMICHVLRYAPFYVAIKERIMAGELGKIFSITTAEHVSYHHYAGCFVRGRWHRYAEGGSSFLMQKCCHDLDLLTWFMSGVPPVRVASLGGLHYFTRANAPANSGTYCLLDCPCENECLYSARKLILDTGGRWLDYLAPELVYTDPDRATLEKVLRDRSRSCGRCVFKLDNDLVDRQQVLVEFADGTVAGHELVGGASRPMRKIHIVGSKGELDGIFDDQKFHIYRPDPCAPDGRDFACETVSLAPRGDVSGALGSHGGADDILPVDFTALVRGEPKSISCTELADSLNGHRIGFAADRALCEHRVVELPPM